MKHGLTQCSEVLERLQPLLSRQQHDGSMLLEELCKAPCLETAFSDTAATPLMHAVSAAYGYIVMFIHVCRTGQVSFIKNATYNKSWIINIREFINIQIRSVLVNRQNLPIVLNLHQVKGLPTYSFLQLILEGFNLIPKYSHRHIAYLITSDSLTKTLYNWQHFTLIMALKSKRSRGGCSNIFLLIRCFSVTVAVMTLIVIRYYRVSTNQEFHKGEE